jgi:hypothetical protein
MEAATREALRRALDAHARARIDWQAEPRCAGCGVEQSDPWSEQYRYVPGCPTCTDRRHKHCARAAARSEQLALDLDRAA